MALNESAEPPRKPRAKRKSPQPLKPKNSTNRASAAIVPIRSDAQTDVLTELNAKHAVLESVGGKCLLMSYEPDEDGVEVVQLQKAVDFKQRYMNRRVEGAQLGQWWLVHPQRRQYRSLIFAPGKGSVVNGSINLWQGFGIEPKHGAWPRMRKHIEEGLACGDKAASEYIIKWLAWSVQNPGRPAEVALVLRSDEEGTGKGMFARALVSIFGRHGYAASGLDRITGRFNGHLRDRAMVFVDEAFVAGGDAGKLYSMITEPRIDYEWKNLAATDGNNALKFILASNKDWVVPVNATARRFAVFDVRGLDGYGTEQQRHAYFSELAQEIEGGGQAAMLHDLLAMDIGGWHPRQGIPQTAALRRQKEYSLDPVDEWLFGLVEEGVIPGGRGDGRRYAAPSALLKDLHAQDPKAKVSVSLTALGRKLSGWGIVKAERVHGMRTARVFPSLDELRAKWCAKFGDRDWNDHTEWQTVDAAG